MKSVTIVIIITAALFVSCKKENNSASGSKEVEIVMEVGPADIDDGNSVSPSDAETKMSHSENTVDATTTHSFQWEEGDEISLVFFNVPTAAKQSASENIINRSSSPFVAFEKAGSSGVYRFRGLLNVDEINTKYPGESGTVPVFSIYPSTELTIGSTSEDYYNSNTGTHTYYYTVTGPVISDHQDGTGWPYCFFVSNKGYWGKGGKWIAGGPELKLSNCLIRFSVTMPDGVDLSSVVIASSDASYLVGPATYWLCSTNNINIAIQRDCTTKSLTISNNGNPLPSEIWFACRALQKDKTYTFTFNASNGKSCSKNLKPKANREAAKIYNLGSLDLTSATWE